jgi:CubicO group peptidase (beta-lactamase class C family)
MSQFKSALKIALCVVVLGISFTSQAKGLNSEKVASFPDLHNTSVVSEFDAEKIAALENRMRQFVSAGDTMGIATLLVHDGKVVSHMHAGVRDIMAGAPIAEDTIYRIYSMTKPITGVAMMMLYEQGKFSLDDPVSKFIPEFEGLEVVKSYEKDGSFELEALERQPTMRELMSHTAGFAYGLYGDDPANLAFMKQGVLASADLQKFIDNVATIPLMHQPGKHWFYSASVDIQGAIIERITGMTLSEYFNSKIFAPLGMPDTAFHVATDKADRLADVFAYHPETKKFQRLPFVEQKYNRLGDMSFRKETRRMESGGGGLVSTLADYARFCQMLANGGELGGIRVLKTESIELMISNVLSGEQNVNIAGTLTQAESDRSGFALNVGTILRSSTDKPGIAKGSYYWGGAAGTWFWIDPVNKLFFIGMIQRFPQGGPIVDFRGVSQEFVYDAMVK